MNRFSSRTSQRAAVVVMAVVGNEREEINSTATALPYLAALIHRHRSLACLSIRYAFMPVPEISIFMCRPFVTKRRRRRVRTEREEENKIMS
jgi:hypothetical protein